MNNKDNNNKPSDQWAVVVGPHVGLAPAVGGRGHMWSHAQGGDISPGLPPAHSQGGVMKLNRC